MEEWNWPPGDAAERSTGESGTPTAERQEYLIPVLGRFCTFKSLSKHGPTCFPILTFNIHPFSIANHFLSDMQSN